MFTKVLILHQLNTRTRASIRALAVFQTLFAGPRSSFNTTFKLITNKTKLIELLILCYVFSFKELGKSSSQEYSSPLLAVTNNLSAPKFVCKIYPLLQFWRCTLEIDVQSPKSGWKSLMDRKILKELCITKACSMFLKLSKLGWLSRNLKNSLPRNTIKTCNCS